MPNTVAFADREVSKRTTTPELSVLPKFVHSDNLYFLQVLIHALTMIVHCAGTAEGYWV